MPTNRVVFASPVQKRGLWSVLARIDCFEEALDSAQAIVRTALNELKCQILREIPDMPSLMDALVDLPHDALIIERAYRTPPHCQDLFAWEGIQHLPKPLWMQWRPGAKLQRMGWPEAQLPQEMLPHKNVLSETQRNLLKDLETLQALSASEAIFSVVQAPTFLTEAYNLFNLPRDPGVLRLNQLIKTVFDPDNVLSGSKMPLIPV
jgi:hypothetical protein